VNVLAKGEPNGALSAFPEMIDIPGALPSAALISYVTNHDLWPEIQQID
jgi:hypothetical protein